MKIVDLNLLLFAVDEEALHHEPAKRQLEEVLSSQEAVGFPWVVLLGFIRMSTNRRIFPNALTTAQAAWADIRRRSSCFAAWSDQNLANHFSVHIRQAALDSVVIVSEALMVQPEKVQKGGVQVIEGRGILDRLVAELVGRAV